MTFELSKKENELVKQIRRNTDQAVALIKKNDVDEAIRNIVSARRAFSDLAVHVHRRAADNDN